REQVTPSIARPYARQARGREPEAPIEPSTRRVPRSSLAVALAALSLAACGPAGFRSGVSAGALERAAHEPPTGAAGPGLERFDALIQSILERSGIPGPSLAMAGGGRPVLARGYGLADGAAGGGGRPPPPLLAPPAGQGGPAGRGPEAGAGGGPR